MTRKQICLAASLVFISSLLLATSSAAAGPEDQHFGPFASTSPDNGSCGNAWAIDTFDRFFDVHNNGDGSFSVREQFKNGSFVTNAGASPGACESDPRHGTTLIAGVNGTFTGYLDFTVTGGTFTPTGCSTAPGACTTTAGFVAVTFPGGTQSCGPTNVCKFGFEYAAGDQGLSYHHWADVSDKTGADLFRGDIANF
jgi:hypothetical protein